VTKRCHVALCKKRELIRHRCVAMLLVVSLWRALLLQLSYLLFCWDRLLPEQFKSGGQILAIYRVASIEHCGTFIEPHMLDVNVNRADAVLSVEDPEIYPSVAWSVSHVLADI
jgi:hypothetical protein